MPVVTSALAPLLATMCRVLSRYACSWPRAIGRVDGDGDDAGADGAEKAQDEVVVVRQDERDPVALAQAERLESAAEARAHALDGRVKEKDASLGSTGGTPAAPDGAEGAGAPGPANPGHPFPG